MKNPRSQRPISSFAALAVFVLFALCILGVLLSGAGVYRRLVREGQESYSQRTCAQYISAKLRQSSGGHRVAVEPFEGTTALVLTEDIDGEDYTTRIYCCNGWLMELFSARDAGLSPADGERLLPAQSLTPVLADGLLETRLVDEYGNEIFLTFSLRGGEEVSR